MMVLIKWAYRALHCHHYDQVIQMPFMNPLYPRFPISASLHCLCFLVFLGVFMLPRTASAQAFTWTWIGGSQQPDRAGRYGQPGIGAPDAWPGARSDAISWKTADGRFWLFGGFGYDSEGNQGNLNDLWVYDPQSQRWTWMDGSKTAGASAVFGQKGQAAPNNVPGARAQAYSWVGPQGRLWLFGGSGVDPTGTRTGNLNDLWSYDPNTGEWTWMAGSTQINQPGTRGALSNAGPNYTPGARIEGVTWTGPNGGLWLFGGDGIDRNGFLNALNDLWMFSPQDSQWRWMGGTQAPDQAGVYTGPSAYPGSRRNSAAFVGQDGGLWLFGGDGYDANGSFGFLNDTWKYDIASNQWQFISGSTTASDNGKFFGMDNLPSGRGGMAYWADAGNRFWIFGGFGLDSQNPERRNLQDLWRFNPQNKTWQLRDGDTIGGSPGQYGVPGQASPDYLAGSRFEGVSWAGDDGALWLLGGFGKGASDQIEGRLNDLWRIEPIDTIPPVVEARDTVVYLPASGTLPLDATSLINRLSDNRYVASVDTRPREVTCASVGNPLTGWVVARDPSGNVDSARFRLEVRDTLPPILTIPNDTSFCQDADNPNGFRFQWTATDNCPLTRDQLEGPPSGRALPVGTTVFRFEAVDASNNRSTANFTATVNATPEAAFSVDTTGPAVRVAAPEQEQVRYTWDWGDGQTTIEPARTQHLYQEGGDYSILLEASTPTGCRDTAQSEVAIRLPRGLCQIPNAFSPNGDGINDQWSPSCQRVLNLEWRIYDRWGALQKSGAGASRSWRGADESGNALPQGQYLYQVCFSPLSEKSRMLPRRCKTGILYLQP